MFAYAIEVCIARSGSSDITCVKKVCPLKMSFVPKAKI